MRKQRQELGQFPTAPTQVLTYKSLVLIHTSMRDFIWLWQLGVGKISLRYSEITFMETLVSGATKIHVSIGYPIIVEETQFQVLCKIDAQEKLYESTSGNTE